MRPLFNVFVWLLCFTRRSLTHSHVAGFVRIRPNLIGSRLLAEFSRIRLRLPLAAACGIPLAAAPHVAMAQQQDGARDNRSAIISSGVATSAQTLTPVPAQSQLRARADDSLWNDTLQAAGQPGSTVRTAEHLQEIKPQIPTKSTGAGSPNAAIPLKPPSNSGLAAAPKSSSTFQMFFSVGSSLLLVLGLFLGVAWCYRKTTHTSSGLLPKHVVSVLGRTPLANRQHVILLRFGPKLVLVSVAQGEARAISEITDPLEVDRIAGHCESTKPGSLSNSFRNVLHQAGRET